MAGSKVNGKAQDRLRWWNALMVTLIAGALSWAALKITGLGEMIAAMDATMRSVQRDITELKQKQGGTYSAQDAAAAHSRFQVRLDDHEERIRELEIRTGRDQ